ncbi:MAG: hypothetical protein MK186_01905, partial [Henriciella sp.]|nr:hypothetical protein [Henriciella sp.]
MSGQADEIDRLPGELDSFVQEAINEGLLRPARPQSAETSPTDPGQTRSEQIAASGQVTTEAAETSPSPEPVTAAPVRVEYLCPETSPYEFTEFSDFSSYSDLAQWRGFLEGEERPTALGRLMAQA